MPLSTTVTRHVTNPRKIACYSATVGLLIFLLFIIITLTVIWHRRCESHDKLARNTQSFVENSFAELYSRLAPLENATQLGCESISSDLTQRAAFTLNIRAILLVANKTAFCSSATGSMQVNIAQISPETDTSKDVDLRLIAQTPMVPGKPALVMWLRDPRFPGSGVMTTIDINLTSYLLLASRQPEVSGIAIVAGDKALTSWEQKVIDLSTLPHHPLRTVTIPGYPITLLLYGETLPLRDIYMVLLVGLLLSLLGAGVFFLLLTLRMRPGKEILLGIKRGEFHVEYQPVIEAATGKTCGLEALLRWIHPTEGRIPPDSFISYAESQNLIAPLTRHLFELVARDSYKFRHAVPAGTDLNLNLSPNHLADNNFCRDVSNWLQAMPQDHFSYVFEITERSMVAEHNAIEMFDWIRSQGISIAIDDFGTGHSALIYLEKFNFDYLKIDRGFVQSIGHETLTSPVLDAVLTLAKKLELHTVAEGVETSEQARWLLRRGVSHLQGYLYSPPCTVSQLIEYFQHESSREPLVS
ncbi:cyclic di-GMP phosphodiesterase [Pantoea sp. BAV 3049]|uniref:cyclic di-GMP phosphodiesterase n=1 Tax=Pantoea sp. BAV 3049 TaxID=2654188 RepID=UPI00131D0A13|nr:cyclic di-GMP phosphodiesterase [Pantoea sp. BAV 3049]